jgi:hypothetical protein
MSFHEDQRVTFAVSHGHNPGIVIDLAKSKYDKVVLTVHNAEEIAARLSVPPSQCTACPSCVPNWVETTDIER